MTNSLVYSTIRRSNRNLLILCIVSALLLIGLAVINKRYFYNFFWGCSAALRCLEQRVGRAHWRGRRYLPSIISRRTMGVSTGC